MDAATSNWLRDMGLMIGLAAVFSVLTGSSCAAWARAAGRADGAEADAGGANGTGSGGTRSPNVLGVLCRVTGRSAGRRAAAGSSAAHVREMLSLALLTTDRFESSL